MSMRYALPLLAMTALTAAEIPKLPAPYHTPSSTNRARVIAQPDGAKLSVPAGFSVELFAEGFDQPRIMLLGPSNEILLSESRGGRITLIKPAKKTLADKLDRPYGLAWHKEYLYVGEATAVKRFKYDKKQMTLGPAEKIFDMMEYGKGHWSRCLLFDAKGEKLYVGVGSASNVDGGEPKERAAILRMNPDGSGREIFAAGTRNPTMIKWYPNTQTLWAAVQERDLIGDDLVPDFLTSIKQGGFYGWPYAYIGPNEDPRRKGEQPELVKSTIVPDFVLGAHVAVLDYLFYTGKQFPKEYQGGAFVALHGSWNRSKRVGQSIGYIPFKNGKPAGEMTQFLTGWMLGEDKPEVWGRPVGLLQMPDGSLLVSEDGNNKIFRISYKK